MDERQVRAPARGTERAVKPEHLVADRSQRLHPQPAVSLDPHHHLARITVPAQVQRDQLMQPGFPGRARRQPRMMSRLAPGSYLVISAVVSDDSGLRETMTDLARGTVSGDHGRIRTKQEVQAFFDGLELVEPGLVKITDWRPDGREEQQSEQWVMFGGVGRKPS